MADSNIGSLPQAQSLDDSSLLVAEQQGQAVKLTGEQLKRYAKQSVELEFKDYLDEAKAAADQATGAVSAVTEMTVEAHDSEAASVTKTMKGGKVNLDFGLPRGEQGKPGPAGATGPRGPRGLPGNGLTILGHYDTEADLRAAVPNPAIGDAYSVGTERPYDTYIFDGVTLDWLNYGPFTGGGGVLPENVVTCEGGATIVLQGNFGDAPHTITITDDEEPPLTAEDVGYGGGTVQEALDDLKSSVSDGKAIVASAITDKGVPTAQDATFAQMAENIGQISTGSDTADATATSFDILSPKTAYTASGKVEGTIPTLPGQTITPGTADKTIANGQYLGGTQVIKGDPNLTSGNIKKGVSIFGVAGSLETSFAATLTVKADIGAVVTATCGDVSVEALSTTGTVVMELPVEGIWKVTAVRGVAQYNTVTLEVSSQYSAELTAEVHIEYYGTGTDLTNTKSKFGATNIGDYVLFAGTYAASSTTAQTSVVDVYDREYIKTNTTISYGFSGYAISDLSAGHTPSYAVFAGGSIRNVNGTEIGVSSIVYAFSKTLTQQSDIKSMDTAVISPASASVGEYVFFGGGETYISGRYGQSDKVNAYDDSLVKHMPTGLSSALKWLDAASNQNYAVFAGGYNGTNPVNFVFAYNKSLTRTLPTSLAVARYSLAAARAGNYVLFAGGLSEDGVTEVVDAYDLFLTRTTPESMVLARQDVSGTTLSDFAVFAGGQKTVLANHSYVTYAYATVDIYDPYLVHLQGHDLSGQRYNVAAASNGNSAFFGGGSAVRNSSTPANALAVDIYRYV